MSKEAGINYEQLMALDLNTDFPGLKPLQGVHTPKMGEARLIHTVSVGNKIPDELVQYCTEIPGINPSLANLITQWNANSEADRNNHQTALSFAQTMAMILGDHFHKEPAHSSFYVGAINQIVYNLESAKTRSTGLFFTS